MTQIGKCDTCRSRKVKCDERKPKCGSCSKKNRPCTYSYGKASALVREDPNQFSGYGKSRSTPKIVPLITSYTDCKDPSSSKSPLRLTMEKESENGHGVFQTFMLTSNDEKDPEMTKELVRSSKSSTSSTMYHSSQSPEPWYAIQFPPSSPTDALAARCMEMFGPAAWGFDSLSIHGSWIQSIPARLGSSPVLDTAVEYAVNGFATYGNKSDSRNRAALVSRSKALKSLRLAIERENIKKLPSYDLLLATKLHSYGEIFTSVGTYAYTYHALGLSKLLKHGNALGMDPEHFWSLVDNTYIDEVNEAALTGRPSLFDTPLYRELTHPDRMNESELQTPLDAPLATTLIMHVLIQIPRLVCLVRHALNSPEDPEALPAAVALACSIWSLSPSDLISSIVSTSTTELPIPPGEEIADVVPTKLVFDSVHSIIVCTRFWSFQIYLCGIIDTLWKQFPAECASFSLIDFELAQQTDVAAASLIAQSLSFSLFYAPSLPLVPLRVLGPLSMSSGPWYRLYSRLRASLDLLEPGTPESIQVNIEMERARRMEDWVIEECHKIHDAWDVARANRKTFELLIDSMAGGEIPQWILNRLTWNEVRVLLKKQGIDP